MTEHSSDRVERAQRIVANYREMHGLPGAPHLSEAVSLVEQLRCVPDEMDVVSMARATVIEAADTIESLHRWGSQLLSSLDGGTMVGVAEATSRFKHAIAKLDRAGYGGDDALENRSQTLAAPEEEQGLRPETSADDDPSRVRRSRIDARSESDAQAPGSSSAAPL